MVFSSLFFVFFFFVLCMALVLTRKTVKGQNTVLLIFSLLFYAWGGPVLLLLLCGVTFICWLGGRVIGWLQRPFYRRLTLFMTVAICILIFVYFKYTNFLGGVIASLMGGEFTALDIFLPVGISFFTFQSLSYTIDVYRRDIKPLTNLLDYAFYVSFFPQLVAGPIVRARDFIPQIRKPLFVSQEMFGRGIFLIVSGLFKKAIISDYISINFVERIFDNPTLYSGVENLMGVYGYALQIYCDFSGYSDMAIGIALLLGFHFNLNFNSPYKSASITEFWRRWHISLSSWLKDYLYISLGGNRKGKFRQYLNLIITMFLGGLWHGASWNFVLWGTFHVVALALH